MLCSRGTSPEIDKFLRLTCYWERIIALLNRHYFAKAGEYEDLQPSWVSRYSTLTTFGELKKMALKRHSRLKVDCWRTSAGSVTRLLFRDKSARNSPDINSSVSTHFHSSISKGKRQTYKTKHFYRQGHLYLKGLSSMKRPQASTIGVSQWSNDHFNFHYDAVFARSSAVCFVSFKARETIIDPKTRQVSIQNLPLTKKTA